MGLGRGEPAQSGWDQSDPGDDCAEQIEEHGIGFRGMLHFLGL